MNTADPPGLSRDAVRGPGRWPARVRLVTVPLLVFVAGCASTDPRADYDRTAQMISDRTGVEQIYAPSGTAERIDELLDGGLSVNEAVQVALLNNRAFQALFHEIGVSSAAVVQSRLLTNPTLGLSLRFPEGGGRSNLSLSLVQQLVDLWQIPIRERIAEADLERTILSVAHHAVMLASETETRYWQQVAFQRLEALGREDVELAHESVELAHDRFRAGEAGLLEVNLARAAALETERRQISLRGDVERARAELARVLGLSRWDRSWSLSAELPEAAAEVLDEGQLLRVALAQRLDAQAAAAEVRAAESEIRAQVLDLLPNVVFGAEWERTENRALPGRKILADTARTSIRAGQVTAPDIQTRGERRTEKSQIIDSLLGPSLEVTLPIWHQNQPQLASARLKAAQRRREFEGFLDQIARDVGVAVATARSAAESRSFIRDRSLPLARENVQAAQRAYQAGQQSIVALIEAQSRLISQRREYVSALRDYAIALAELRQAVGGRIPFDTRDATTATQPSEPGEIEP